MTKRKNEHPSNYKIITKVIENDKQEIDKILNNDEFFQVFKYLMDKYEYREW